MPNLAGHACRVRLHPGLVCYRGDEGGDALLTRRVVIVEVELVALQGSSFPIWTRLASPVACALIDPGPPPRRVLETLLFLPLFSFSAGFSTLFKVGLVVLPVPLLYPLAVLFAVLGLVGELFIFVLVVVLLGALSSVLTPSL